MVKKIINYNFSFPLTKGVNGYFAFNTNVENAIREDIKNLLFTRHGERIPEMGYGTGVLNYLFEPKTNDLKLKISSEIRNAILKWVKGVNITNIVVVFSEDLIPTNPYFGKVVLNDHSVMIVIYYEIQNRNANFIIPNQNIALILGND